eukprot:579030-Prymnesium_polylepis.2
MLARGHGGRVSVLSHLRGRSDPHLRVSGSYGPQDAHGRLHDVLSGDEVLRPPDGELLPGAADPHGVARVGLQPLDEVHDLASQHQEGAGVRVGRREPTMRHDARSASLERHVVLADDVGVVLESIGHHAAPHQALGVDPTLPGADETGPHSEVSAEVLELPHVSSGQGRTAHGEHLAAGDGVYHAVLDRGSDLLVVGVLAHVLDPECTRAHVQLART